MEKSFHINNEKTTKDDNGANDGDGWTIYGRVKKPRVPHASSFTSVPKRTERWGNFPF